MDKIKVLVIDDSALIRQILSRILNGSDSIEVVGTAPDPLIARDKIKRLNPDVLTLDVEMPKMNGLTFLRNLMRLRPMPVVMVSSLTEKGAEVTLEALELGAVDFVAKPKSDVENSLEEYASEIIDKVKIAAKATLRGSDGGFARAKQPTSTIDQCIVDKHSADVIIQPKPITKQIIRTEKIIAIGSSTGGTEAVKTVVKDLPADTPAIVISQHLPAAFSASFARHVNDVTAMTAVVANDGQVILPGYIYIAPGGKHLLLMREGTRYSCRLHDGPPVNRHKPAVDVMFRSVAQSAGNNAIGIMLTGMGADGAVGMLEMREAGSTNIVQDEASSVVWGMPGEAYRLGAAHRIEPLGKIARIIRQLI
jgi:two-component system, chemotaxis family, protein-glutamate methylesterase/glutaminase